MAAPLGTCDLCDAYRADAGRDLRALPPGLLDYGGVTAFSGAVVTVQCHDDNSFVKAAVESPGAGAVLVVDGGGSLRRALLGGNLAAAAARNGWAGIVIDGCVRDLAELRALPIGIRALGAMPLPTDKRNVGQRDVAIAVRGVPIRPGDWLAADADGIVVLAAAPG